MSPRLLDRTLPWRRLKHYCEGAAQYGLNVPTDQYLPDGVRLIRTTDIRDDGSLSPESEGIFVSPDLVEQRHLLRRGDILFSRSGSLGRCFRIAAMPGSSLTFAGFLVRFRPRDGVDARFLEYCAAARFVQETIAAEAVTSTISNFNAERYSNLLLPDRSPAEQRAIADYLDAETARIDALIANKRRMIHLLDERFRTAVRHQMDMLVSSYGPLPLKRFVRCLDGQRVPLSAEERSTRSGPYPYFGASGQIDSVDDYLFDETLVLLGEDGAQLGDPDFDVSFVVTGKVWVNNHAHVLRPIAADPHFLSMHLATVDRNLVISGATREKITQCDMERISVPNVDVDVQRRVVRQLLLQRDRTRACVERLGSQVALLQEHRQTLITAAVTGELDVEGSAA